MEMLLILFQAIILFSGSGLWIAGLLLALKSRNKQITGLFLLYTMLCLRIAVNIVLALFYQVEPLFLLLIRHRDLNLILLSILSIINRSMLYCSLLLAALLVHRHLGKRTTRLLGIAAVCWVGIHLVLLVLPQSLPAGAAGFTGNLEEAGDSILFMCYALVLFGNAPGKTVMGKKIRLLAGCYLFLYAVPLFILQRIISTPLLTLYFQLGGFFLLSVYLLASIITCLLNPIQPGNRTGGWDLRTIAGKYGFSRREVDVFRLLAEYQSYKAIAEALCISLDTVKSHARSIYRKTATKNRTELIKQLPLRT